MINIIFQIIFLLDFGSTASLRRKIINGTTLFISVGKNRRVYPRDLIQLFVGTGKISREDIGEIKVLDSYSFITIKEASAATAIDNLDGINSMVVHLDKPPNSKSVGF